MITQEWMQKYAIIKEKLVCYIDLDAYFTKEKIGQAVLDILQIGMLHLPTGKVLVCDPLIDLEIALPFIQEVPPGNYPVSICVSLDEDYGNRYVCVKIAVGNTKPVRYELGMTGNEDLDEIIDEGEYFGFNVDTGMGCICDLKGQEAFKTYWKQRESVEEGIDPYNDLFCELLEENYEANPKYQREGGDWLNWTIPGSDCNIPIFASGWGDGLYPCYFGYDAENKVCGIYILFIDVTEDDMEEQSRKDERKKLNNVDTLLFFNEDIDKFYEQLEQWNIGNKFKLCIQALDTIPREYRDYKFTYTYVRALENYAIIGDDEIETNEKEAVEALNKAIALLESVREEGKEKAQWYMRMAYAYQYLNAQEEKAIEYAKCWAELDPEDKNALDVIHECEKEIIKRQRKKERKKLSKKSLDNTPFEGLDLSNFWDDDDYACKEYVSDVPTDDLIADIEKELGYKLPASYIWLMKQHNGGIPFNTCFPTDVPTSWAEDHVAITGIFGIGREKDYSLCGGLGSQFMIDEWGYPAIGVAICDCPSAGHDMIFLDYRECGPQGEPSVVHVDQECDYEITLLADNFEEFIRGLENEEAYENKEDE